MEGIDESTRTAAALAARWAGALLARRAPDGSLACPACDFRHGRVVELAFPFVARWRRTGEARWLDAAAGFVDWAERHTLLPDGCYANDPGDGWTGTTEFAQIALARALLAGGDALPAALRERWLAIVRRQAGWLRAWIDPPESRVNVNYRAAHSLAMELAARVLGDADGALRASGAAQARRALSLVSPADGLIFGECHPMERVSPRGFHGVDIGYNLEETLPALVEQAELANDAAALDAALRCARAHLPFLLPDGAIDDSFGTRAHKWSYWGSRTSDGVLPLLAALARRGDATAAARIPAVLSLYARCTTRDGLLAGGPHYEAAGEPPCIHHTFGHLASLEAFFASGPRNGGAAAPEPEPAGEAILRSFPSTGAHVATAGDWRATFSENDFTFHPDGAESVGGGCLSLLWHRALGPLCAATTARYVRPEPNNAQASRTDPATRCLAPRVETPDGAFLNLCAHDARVAARAKGGAAVVGSEGVLRGLDGAAGPAFALRHRLAPDGLEIRARCAAPARLVLPVVALPDETVALAPDGRSATVAKPGGALSLRSSRPLALLPTARPDGRAFCPCPGFLCVPFAVDLAPGEEALLVLSAAPEGAERP